MWIIWVLSLLGPLLLSFKKGGRSFLAVIGLYGVSFWISFGLVMQDTRFFSSAALFGMLGVYNAYYSHKLQERKRKKESA